MRIGRAARAGVVAVATVIAIAAQAPTAAASQVNGLCAWPVRDNADLVNVAFPDESATTGGRLRWESPRPGWWSAAAIRAPATSRSTPTTQAGRIRRPQRLGDRTGAGLQPIRQAAPSAGGAAGTTRRGSWKVRSCRASGPQTAPEHAVLGRQHGVPNPATILVYRVYVPDDPRIPRVAPACRPSAPSSGARRPGRVHRVQPHLRAVRERRSTS